MKTVFHTDPRYLLFAVPDYLITGGLDPEDIVEMMFLKLADLGDSGDFFMIPIEETHFYEQAVAMTREVCERKGLVVELVDDRNSIVRVGTGTDAVDHHLRVVFCGAEQSDQVEMSN